MRDDYPWGLWFVDYMYYIGLAAGGLVVYASVHLFGAKQFTAAVADRGAPGRRPDDDGAHGHPHRHGASVRG